MAISLETTKKNTHSWTHLVSVLLHFAKIEKRWKIKLAFVSSINVLDKIKLHGLQDFNDLNKCRKRISIFSLITNKSNSYVDILLIHLFIYLLLRIQS